MGSTHYKLSGEPLENDCPWSWAPNCFYNSYVFESELNDTTESEMKATKKINVIMENKETVLSLKVMNQKKTDGLTVCVQPVYWYSQFQNIVLFIESWINQGATHFIVYFHSSTKEVHEILKHYQRIGILTIKPWPSFPNLPSNFPEINSQVYRIGHTMAANLCILQMNTTLGTIVDFDELIVPTMGNIRILEYVKQELRIPGVSALEFGLTRIQLDLTSDKTSFNRKSIETPTFINKKGPPKLIFNTTSVAIIVTHSIRKFIEKTDKTTKAFHGLLLHYRYNGGQVIRNIHRNFKIFSHDFDRHIMNMKNVTEQVFGDKIHIFNPEIIVKLNECIQEISVAKLCRSTVPRCKARMTELGAWIFENSPGFDETPVQFQIDIEETVIKNQVNASFPIIFYQNAYVDNRYSPPRLRIFSLNKCIKKKHFLLVDLFYEGVIKPTRMMVYGESLEGNCPSSYGPARPCFYVAHTFLANLTTTGGMTNVLIHMGSRKVKLSVKEINKRYEEGITICLQPVYYYSQWQNIVLYIEAWKAQGATRFIVFYHSATKETRQVLDYYRNLGIIEFRSWPSFANLPEEIAGKYPKVDDSVFIFSYFLAMNICILDIKTTIGTIADFDEVMVPRNGTMLEYATKEMENTNVGALSFGNNYVAMEPSIYSSDFSGVSSPIFIDKGGPSKYIFNASVIDIAQVHFAKSFIDTTKHSKGGDGALLHLRFGTKKDEMKKMRKPFRFFPNNDSLHIQNMQDTANTIFNGNIPTFSSKLIDGVNKCVKRINKEGNTCRSTGGLCKSEMDELTEWVYDTTEGIFLSH